MNLYLALTDNRWFRFLRSRAPLEEVNCWRPEAFSAEIGGSNSGYRV